jgi:hypothetical protein
MESGLWFGQGSLAMLGIMMRRRLHGSPQERRIILAVKVSSAFLMIGALILALV